jgi:hypothetical protein
MNLEARLIRLKEKLDAKALRDPRTVKEYAVRDQSCGKRGRWISRLISL